MFDLGNKNYTVLFKCQVKVDLCLGARIKALARSYVHSGLVLIMTSRGRVRTITLAREPKALLQQYPMHHHGYSLPDLGPGYMWALLAPFRASPTSYQ